MLQSQHGLSRLARAVCFVCITSLTLTFLTASILPAQEPGIAVPEGFRVELFADDDLARRKARHDGLRYGLRQWLL